MLINPKVLFSLITFILIVLLFSVQVDAKSNLMKLSYEVIFEDLYEGTATVKMNLTNVRKEKIIIRNHGYHGFHANIESKGLKIYDNNGKLVKYKYMGEKGRSFDTSEKEWEIYPSDSKTVTIEFQVEKNKIAENDFLHRGYIGKGFALFSGEQVIALYPYERDKWDKDIKVTFQVPENTEVFTPWVYKDGVYYPNSDFYDKYKNYVEKKDNLMQSTIVIGSFESITQDIDGTNVSVVMPKEWEKNRQEEAADNIFNLFGYYNKLFGKSLGEEYMVSYTDLAHDNKGIWAGEWSLSQGTAIEKNDYKLPMIAHQIFHRWNSWIWGWFNDRDQIGHFLVEGNNRYYEGKSIITLIDKLNYLSTYDVNFLKNIYNEYLKRYNEGLITPYFRKNFKTDVDSWIDYGQGALIWFALDMQLYEDTKGKVSTDYIMESIDSLYGQRDGSVGYKELLNVIKSLTGRTYEDFFDKYVFGSEFLDLNEYFLDSDGDSIPNYYKIIRSSITDRNDVIPLNVRYLFDLEKIPKKVLVIGSRNPCEAFKRSFGLGDYLTSNPTSQQVAESNIIVLLNYGSNIPKENLNIVQPVYTREPNVVNIKINEGKLLIYINGFNEYELIRIIDTLNMEELFEEGLRSR